ncbi:lipoyltransferase 1, mitochondrial [Syngnathoides biaculeatus]|uniref:lipoyltransferase 1, mitochondrial n=1 Tax=Syngnathoides biaculeatus TaxID=300417 RepID=UPI002ADDD81F|nr:lipoyltransferase 1, mitochondrial [Syngnathoides biaculeatus]XP_061693768.1 lipoyltransferase 1, mitochondrial [Syngnathoides biaculeatus]XP_061693776.1 lipoyltransferase 1, mitochondrial [Syngnathoides biaculeatus]XP_061693784.1 lipoyltransferase 1, mitochondrial [Syngnathoides biaculeatus]XP_061693794.1 lipoyltransferase 1, mitochondrial [Syngnathoides biaculeatus]
MMGMLSHVRGTLAFFRGSFRSGNCDSVARVTRTCSTLLTDTSEGGLVLYSQSNDVYENLSLEDWIEANVDLQRLNVLLLWRNTPAVVIGRHQNPWKECNLSLVRRSGISLARRRSGGGTVFHDLGNLNLTFFASKKAYDRQRNLKVITEALRRLRPGLDVKANERFDIFLKGCFKITGSASRISRKSSYHHCTLLHSADHSTLSPVLRSSCQGVNSNATPSVPSPVANLVDHDPTLTWEALLDALANQYCAEFGGRATMNVVNPADESAFPGLSRTLSELREWDWIFGKTPKFSIQTALKVTDDYLSAGPPVGLCSEIKHGLIESCSLDVPTSWLPRSLIRELSSVLVGQRFCPHHAAAVFSMLLRCETGEKQNRLQRLCDAILAVMG